MSLSRTSGLAAVMIAGALALTACGSDGGSGSTSSAPAANIDCASGSIKASGSSAQKNAIAEWVNAYIAACPDATIDYQADRFRRRCHRLPQQADRVRRL